MKKQTNLIMCPHCKKTIDITKEFPICMYFTKEEWKIINNRLSVPERYFTTWYQSQGMTIEDFRVPMSLIKKTEKEDD